MTVYIRAESVTVDSDEGRFVLVVSADDFVSIEEDCVTLRIDIQADVLEFYDRVRKDIGPYAAEAESARSAVSRGVTLEEYTGGDPVPDEFGYALDDPKHPTYHDRMVD